MGATTHRIEVNDSEYTNVSNGNLNCYLFLRYGQTVRVHVGGDPPDPDVVDFFVASGIGADEDQSGRKLARGFTGLAAEDEVWVRLDEPGMDAVVVVRGGELTIT